MKVRRIDHWPDEWLVGVAGMTWDEIGAYHVICDLIYSSGRPILSNDPRLVTFGGGHRNRVNSMIFRLESLGKLTTNPVDSSEIPARKPLENLRKSAGKVLESSRKVLEISVTRCTIELENARNRIENKTETSKTNGLDSHARGHTHARTRPHAGDSNLQPSTNNLQPPTHAPRTREESGLKNGKWKKAGHVIPRHNLAHSAGGGPPCQCATCEACTCVECLEARRAYREKRQTRNTQATPDSP